MIWKIKFKTIMNNNKIKHIMLIIKTINLER